DPPGVSKPNPSSVLEAWVDPRRFPSIQKAMESIGKNLVEQFHGLSSDPLLYKQIQDPTYDNLRQSCLSLRQHAKEDAVLFHYNGHGAPKPTARGELWCFNRNYTQYLAVSLRDVEAWVGAPAIYIWDCSGAGQLLNCLFAEQAEYPVCGTHWPPIHLAACTANEKLPTSPELPADLFTSCLTSPMSIALRYFMLHNQLPEGITADMVLRRLPGTLDNRRSPLGELNYIFVTITLTIAWTSFSPDVFARLYRANPLISALFRNFLLAERVMKDYDCTPHTYPPLPTTKTHALWATWDLAVDECLRQLPELLKTSGGQTEQNHLSKWVSYIPSRYFGDQLTAFGVWISRNGVPLRCNASETMSTTSHRWETHLVSQKLPRQLPATLHTLLCNWHHRLPALILLSQFVDLGSWAVHIALEVGILPYIVKLLQCPNPDLRPPLIFIWARILAVDPSIQVNLIATKEGYDSGCTYFAKVLGRQDDSALPNPSELKAMCSFILSIVSRGYHPGQEECIRTGVMDLCFNNLVDLDPLLRQWSALCISQIWDGNETHKARGLDSGIHDKLVDLLQDVSVEVRCAALHALGTFIGVGGFSNSNGRTGEGSGTMSQSQLDTNLTHMKMEVTLVTSAAATAKQDASPMYRRELVVLLSFLVKEYQGFFVVCAWLYGAEDRHQSGKTQECSSRSYRSASIDMPPTLTAQAINGWLDRFKGQERTDQSFFLSSFFTLFVFILELSADPCHEVASAAQRLFYYIMARLLESPFAQLGSSSFHFPRQAPGSQYSFAHSPGLGSFGPCRTDTTDENIQVQDGSWTSVATGALKWVHKAFTAFFSSTRFRETGGNHHARSNVVSLESEPDIHYCPRSPNENLSVPRSALHDSMTLVALQPDRANQPNYPNLPPSSPTRPPGELMTWSVVERLVEEDMGRLTFRRSSLSNPDPRRKSASSMNLDDDYTIHSSETGDVPDDLPVKSSLFDWCCEYFTEPQMREAETHEPECFQSNYQLQPQRRNEQVVVEPQILREFEDIPVATVQIPGPLLAMTFHAFDANLFMVDESNAISVWDWSRQQLLSSFHNGNPLGTSVTSLQVINQNVGGIILTGSSDGALRFFRNYDSTSAERGVQMISAFRALDQVQLVKQSRDAGIVMEWEQSTGTLIVGGESRIIRVWDAYTETSSMDLNTNSENPVTSIVSHDSIAHSQIFAASFGNGEVKVYDRRLGESNSVIRQYTEHKSWVQNICCEPTSDFQFLSASLGGRVKLWDLRCSASPTTWDVDLRHGLSFFDCHPTTRIFAATSAITPNNWKSHCISVHSLKQDVPMSSFNLSTGLKKQPSSYFVSPFVPRLNSVTFHPTEMLYGVSEPDGTGTFFFHRLITSRLITQSYSEGAELQI
ncbi:hypothetical protein C8R43DRAFT_879598, partial [Mycena crocata]